MEILAIIGVIGKIVSVVNAAAELAPAAIETAQAAAKAYDLVKKVITKDPAEVTQAELDEIIATAEALETEILQPIAPPEV